MIPKILITSYYFEFLKLILQVLLRWWLRNRDHHNGKDSFNSSLQPLHGPDLFHFTNIIIIVRRLFNSFITSPSALWIVRITFSNLYLSRYLSLFCNDFRLRTNFTLQRVFQILYQTNHEILDNLYGNAVNTFSVVLVRQLKLASANFTTLPFVHPNPCPLKFHKLELSVETFMG